MAQGKTKAAVYMVTKDGDVTRLRSQTILRDSKNKGHLKSGIPVKKIGDRWFYKPK